MKTNEMTDQLDRIRRYYATGETRSLEFRKKTLKRFRETIRKSENDILSALQADLGKSPEEGYMSEVSIVLKEIDYQLRCLKRWMKPRKVGSPVMLFPSRSRIVYEPKGVVLILSPWNYPFQLAINPLVGAIAAGNCVVLRPSTTSAHTSCVMARIVKETFAQDHVLFFEGDHEKTTQLLEYRFDHIFFTGSGAVGRQVMAAAARNLVPVTLELGGKSPCVVDAGADLKTAARRVAWGKLLNAGQTCIAPDYLFVHERIRDAFLKELKRTIHEFFGRDPLRNPSYPHLISQRAFDRLSGCLSEAEGGVWGGECDKERLAIAPAIVETVTPDMRIMREEIFGPLLPVMTFSSQGEVVDYVNSHDKPLAFYYFGKKAKGLKMLSEITSGGACINDTVLHIVNSRLPFGGAGESGMGRYHGRWSFETFSNVRSLLISPRRFDLPFRYPPYRPLRLLKKIM